MTILPLSEDFVPVCGTYQPAPAVPYRCTRPHGHTGMHEAVIDGQIAATWLLGDRREDGGWGPSTEEPR